MKRVETIAPNPEPIVITIAATRNISASRIESCDLPHLSHLSASLLSGTEENESDALLKAIASSLAVIARTDARRRIVTLRTSSHDLIWAAEFLLEEMSRPGGRPPQTLLESQLQEFNVTWELVGPDDRELIELQRWAEEEFKPRADSKLRLLTLADSKAIERSLLQAAA